MSEIVEHNFDLAEEARKYISSNKDYTLHSFENSLSICFNYKDYDPRIIVFIVEANWKRVFKTM